MWTNYLNGFKMIAVIGRLEMNVKERELWEKIEDLKKRFRYSYLVVAKLVEEEGCRVETPEYGWSTVKMGTTTVHYPFAL